jgi:hypothetical protein
MSRQGRYPQELHERAVRLVSEHQDEHHSQWAAITSIAHKVGCRAPKLDPHAASAWYSWINPPRTSRHLTDPGPAATRDGEGPSGTPRPRPSGEVAARCSAPTYLRGTRSRWRRDTTKVRSTHSWRAVLTHRSATALALGAGTGVRITRTSWVRNTSSNEPENLASRSRRRTRTSSKLHLRRGSWPAG